MQAISLFLHFAWQWLRLVGRALHRLWLETTGSIFLVLMLLGLISAWKEWSAYLVNGKLWKPLSTVAFVLMTGSFGIYSFLKARRLR